MNAKTTLLAALLLVPVPTAVAAEKPDTVVQEYVMLSTNWPEIKTEWPVKCVAKAFGDCVLKTKVPRLYRRTSKLQVVAIVTMPNEDRLIDDVEECIFSGSVAGLLTGYSIGAELGVAAFKTALEACLVVKGYAAADDVDVDLKERKKPGRWKRI